ncbi:MAG: SLBB domain-containing protein [Gemmatimonadales bacterium]
MRSLWMIALSLASLAPAAVAQRPTPEQAQALLRARPDLQNRVRSQISGSGLTPDQIRARLVAAGYPATLLDSYLSEQSDPAAGEPSASTLSAIRSLGLAVDYDGADSIGGAPGSPRQDVGPLRSDTLTSHRIFGLDVFRRVTTQFQASATGPVDPSYRLGPGDGLVLILTGDVELAHTLDVTREGFIVIPQVGQLHVAGLTMQGLEDLLYSRLGRVYSGVSRNPEARTRFQVTVSKLRTNQIFVVGDVALPGSYQVSSAGTVLSALYLAGGPTAQGSFRRIEIRRAGRLVDSLDIYDYLLRGANTHDVRLESGDVVFVPVRGPQVRVGGAVTRPATYELAPGETLRDVIVAAGGFESTALRRRIQIERILPPSEREPGGRDRVLLDIAEDQVSGDLAPGFTLVAGDVVRIFSIAERRRNVVTVSGNVWNEGPVGFRPGMRLSEAIQLAGGPKADVYLEQVLVSRLARDSTRFQLRSAFADTTGRIANDLALQEDDLITVYSRTSFRPTRYVVVTGAVNQSGRIPYRTGMTLRDAILDAGGVTQEAWLQEAEIARLPEDRSAGTIATAIRTPLDSTYLFDRGPDGSYQGPPGLPGRARGAPDFVLEPYDNVLIFRQPDWELQRQVVLTGQVRFPGVYSLQSRTDRLTDLIDRAGGLGRDAYPLGAALFRRRSALKSEEELIKRLTVTTDTSGLADTTSSALGTHLAERVGLDLPRAMEDRADRHNVILVAGDSLHIPEFDPTVRILGAVNAPTTLVHRQGWDVDDYVGAAGGYSREADRGRTYLVQPSGSVESVKRRFLFPDSKPTPSPGAVVFVPERDPAERRDWAGLLGSIAQILASTVAIVVVATR